MDLNKKMKMMESPDGSLKTHTRTHRLEIKMYHNQKVRLNSVPEILKKQKEELHFLIRPLQLNHHTGIMGLL